MEINILQGGQIVQGKTFLDDGLESGDTASPSFPQKKVTFWISTRICYSDVKLGQEVLGFSLSDQHQCHVTHLGSFL